ncbi:retropepsin-like aspartic protease [Aquirufa sp. ROCK-SH2]
MRIRLYSLFIILLTFSCRTNQKFYNSGNVESLHEKEEISINQINDLPFCSVEIGDKKYQFLIDTGAPTIISEEIFQRLNLKIHHQSTMSDSHNKKKKEKFVIVPEIKIGNLIIKDIACSVTTIETKEIKCLGLDGIVGANLLAKLFCEFDYQNNKINVSKKINSFDMDNPDFIWTFRHFSQKTPKIMGEIFDKKLMFTFDTGFNGSIKIPSNLNHVKLNSTNVNMIITEGISSTGFYGVGNSEKGYVIKNNIKFDHVEFKNQFISSGKSTLIGNEFLKDYLFLMDWENRKIYFKKHPNQIEKTYDSFGFSYLFVDGKAKVVYRITDRDIPINLGDEIIKIDDVDFTKIEPSDICQYYLNKVEKNKASIDITIKRNNQYLSFHLDKQVYYKN